MKPTILLLTFGLLISMLGFSQDKIHVLYKQVDTTALYLDVIYPENNQINNKKPAIVFSPNYFFERMNDGKQHLLISKPTRMLSFWITSANQKEKRINNLNKFHEQVV